MYEENCFITLTLNDQYLQHRGYPSSTQKEELQKFWKRLRKSNPNKEIRYYAASEYGDNFDRPHYHACVFNHDFDDKKFFKISPSGERLYISDKLHNLWTDPKSKIPMGYCYIGEITFQSAAYVARYCTKKVGGDRKEEHYTDEYGVIKEPEQQYHSIGIGRPWFEKYKEDVINHDHVIIEGKSHPVPRYYDKLLERENLKLLENNKENRLITGLKYVKDKTKERLAVRERVKLAQLKILKGTY